MDARVGSGAYPAMKPLVDEPLVARTRPEPGPDHLVGVADAAGARAALDTAERLVLLDGRATVWQVAERLALALLALGVMAATAARGGLLRSTWVLLLGAAAVVLLSVASSRAAGMTTTLLPRWADGLVWCVFAGILLWWAVAEPVRWWAGPLLAVAVVGYALAPVALWTVATRRARGVQAWPPGAQAFALLSLLDRAGAVAPDRLIALAGLTPVNGDRWLERLGAEQAVTGGRRRHWVLGDQRVRLTPPGHERLRRMREELERVAAAATAG